jgi:precorrin-4 methylase
MADDFRLAIQSRKKDINGGKMKKTIFVLILAGVLSTALVVVPRENTTDDRGYFYLIGTGPAGPHLATLQALDALKRMDAIVAEDQHVRLFSEYICEKPVLFDPWEGLYSYKGKPFRLLNREEMGAFKKERILMVKSRTEEIRKYLARGKNVGLLDNGNPMVFGPSNWYLEEFSPQETIIIPGMGSDAVALAALGKSALPAHDARFVLQSSPFYLMDHQTVGIEMLKEIAKYPSTTILYMALAMPERLFALLQQVYPPDMPCAVVYWAGYPDRQRLIKGTISDIASKISQEEEKYMGLLFIGKFLEGQPYSSAMK